MSIEVTNAVWKHSRQKSGTLLVLLALADYTNSEGIAWPAVSTLAGKARMSERNVQRCVSALQKAGELEVRQNQGRKGSNIYRIRLLPDVNTPDATDIRDASVAKGVSPTSLTSDAVVTQSVSEPLIESTPIVPKGDEIEFWIQVCFDCFKLTRHPLPVHVLHRLARDIRFLDRKNADSLRRFHKCEPLTSKSHRTTPEGTRRSDSYYICHVSLGLHSKNFRH
jgi:Helix-turn-helix domain